MKEVKIASVRDIKKLRLCEVSAGRMKCLGEQK